MIPLSYISTFTNLFHPREFLQVHQGSGQALYPSSQIFPHNLPILINGSFNHLLTEASELMLDSFFTFHIQSMRESFQYCIQKHVPKPTLLFMIVCDIITSYLLYLNPFSREGRREPMEVFNTEVRMIL